MSHTAGGKDDNETLYQEGRRHVNEQAIFIQDVKEGQIVSLSNLVVIMVMSRGDFDSAWTENGAERQAKQRTREKRKKRTIVMRQVAGLNDLLWLLILGTL